MSKVKEYSEWVYTMLDLPKEKRREWVKLILDNIRSYRKDKPDKNTKYLSDMLQDKKKFDMVGFAPNVQYVKHDLRKGDTDADLENIFIHAFGTPKLLYKHKDLPILIIVGADLRLDKSVLDEIKDNETNNVRGITG